ncbi:MAG: hypothetical protein Kow0080_01230 [Candidatus Promineifilaceae bacterium]
MTLKVNSSKTPIWQTIRGFVAGIVALIACPCHLPLTLPLILALTAGTAVGGWLAANTKLIYLAATIFFIGGLALAGKWLLADNPQTCDIQPRGAKHEQL